MGGLEGVELSVDRAVGWVVWGYTVGLKIVFEFWVSWHNVLDVS